MNAVTQEEDLQARIRLAQPQVIGSQIKRARTEIGQTLDAFAADLGTNRSHIIKLERGDHRPHARTLLKIAARTTRDPDWFLDPEVDPKSRPFPDGSGSD